MSLSLLVSDSDYSLQGYDDIPKEIPDPDAKKVRILLSTYIVCASLVIRSSTEIQCHIIHYLLQPEDWDDEEDGEWTVPTIPNPEYKGPWKQKVCAWLGGLVMLDKPLCTMLQLLTWVNFALSENQEPRLQGQVEGSFDWQPRYITFLILKVNNINLRVNLLSMPPFLLNKKAHSNLFLSWCTDYKDDPYIYAFDSLKHIGIELWQVSGLAQYSRI